MFLPLRNAEIISAVSSALSQKCSGSSYPYIRNGFFKLSVIQEVSNITQIALRKLRNKNTIFLSYHQTFSSRFFEFYLLHTDSHGFSFHTEYRGWSRIFFFSFLVPNYRIIEFLSSHGISRTVTDFLFSFLVPNFRIIEFYLFVPRLVLCPEFSNFCLHTEYHGLSRIFFFLFLSRIIEFSNFCLP